MIKTILQKDDPALHKVCHPITKFDAKLAGLLGDMTDTLKQSGGLGLAAPQIGILRRVCVILDEDETTYLELINPEILSQEGEQEGFEPIEVRCVTDNVTCSDEQLLVIHDGRHLPSDIDHQPSAIMIEIDAHLAFGTGTHETTRMICATLLGTPLKGKRVLDCGCGTGILGICALKLGAAQCTAYDIDEWSVDNTRHNSIINQVDSQLTVMHGDASLLDSQQVSFDLVMANINRNILLQDMSRFVSVMAPGSTLLLSGFYEEDCEMLTHAAQACGLTLNGKKQDDAWAMLIFTRP